MLTNIIIALSFICIYFGLYCLIDFIDFKYKGNNINKSKSCNNYVVTLFVRNADDNIEHILQQLKLTCMDDLTICDKIFIIDMGSCDATPSIIQKISEQDESVEILRAFEKERIFEIFESISR